ncbi:hypothetical protein [Thermobacillus sp. ZCTH02-B1]|uniref:hypothetical protein n=1 Tax=Thermobacillus sp. ZCTH02-B1 TaxID=1858795 RepID=UPI0025E79B6B|nr:hypothetical protein [Thermobacillus sp. ZCTH02-B1]
MSIRLNPYLTFDGNARAAVRFYGHALGGKITGIMTYGDLPSAPDHPVPGEAKDRVLHAPLKVGDAELMFSDTSPARPIRRAAPSRSRSCWTTRRGRGASSTRRATAAK